MEIRNKNICGVDAVRVRDAFRAFLDFETPPMSFENGQPKFHRKIVDADFLAREMGLTEAEAARLLDCLTQGGYIDGLKQTPTPQGMALAHAEDRDRLPLREAETVLSEFLEAVKKINSRSGARVFVERVFVFGSFLAGADTVGDIDLLLFMKTPQEDLEPEDMDEEDEVIEAIKTSEYLSFHDEFDRVAMEADKRLIYDRIQAS